MEGRESTLSGLERRRRRLELHAVAQGRQVRLTVRDHGTGIPPEVQQRMFDAFFTTKDVGKGTGLGLSICNEIVHEMGGTLEFETGPHGTAFHVVLPEAGEG